MILSLAEWRQITGDRATPDDRAEWALSLAQRQVEDHCQREFELAERHETVTYGPSYVPRAYPIHDADGQLVDGFVVYGLQAGDTLTYTGGYAPGEVPATVQLVVAELAQRALLPANTVGIPAGTTNVSVDGQGYSGGVLGGLSSLPPAVKNALRPYRHITARLP